MPPAGNWLRFSCSIPPLFVLSHSLPMINTMGKLALFCTFLSPPASSLRFTGHGSLVTRPLLTRHSPLATRHSSHLPLGTSVATTVLLRPSPVGYCMPPTAGFRKDRTGPDLDERPHYFIMSPIQAISSDKSIRFSPLAAARPLTIRSWPEGLNASASRVFEATMPPSLATIRRNWKNQFSNLSSLDTSCRSPLILVMRSFGTGVFPPSSIRT